MPSKACRKPWNHNTCPGGAAIRPSAPTEFLRISIPERAGGI